MMNYRYMIMLIAALAMALPPLSAEDEDEAPPAPLAAAIFNFTDGDASVVGTGANVGQLLNAFLSAEGGLMLVEREELKTVLAEQKLSLSGTVDPTTAVGVGRLTGAKVIVTGRAFPVGGNTFLVAKIISAETSRTFGETVQFKGDDNLSGASQELAGKIAAAIRKHRDALVRPAETAKARIARLKEAIPEGAELPKVFVSIPEEHLTRRVPDPAAQTEIFLTLEQLGFPITDRREDAKIVVSGEAFSERAAELEGLVSCRARVEIEVHDAAGELLFVDRQTEVAVDLAENVAAKSALQKAGAMLAERIVAKLVAK